MLDTLSRVDSGPRAPYRRRRRWFWAAGAFAILALAQLGTLKQLPYSSCCLEKVDAEELTRASNSRFTLGSIRWDVEEYARDPKLEVFRAYYREKAAGKRGLEAAVVLMDRLLQDIRRGNPSQDFLRRDFDPVASFTAHLRGDPGHCVTLSGSLATILLSVGIPARVVQFVPADNAVRGHTVVEVWDERNGWLLVDALYGGTITNGKSGSSAFHAIHSADKLRFVEQGTHSETATALGYYEDGGLSIQDGSLVYPEPWLYLRTGPRASSWPFMGKFAVAGRGGWLCGPAQNLLRIGFLACGIVSLLCLCVAAWRTCFVAAPIVETAGLNQAGKGEA